ncbi:MAG TPA: N-acetyl-gamma-glutamyl-phosphate reductase [Actinomycetota bacterium]|nr:N-acetyl-gamma-glutamyl-phosphate reductase [Actinomycetota bacterium]
MGTSAVILGASGFGGGELLRYLSSHPGIDAVALGAGSKEGMALGEVHPNLLDTSHELLPLEDAARHDADVCFSCLPSGILGSVIDTVAAPVIVDVADDYRGDDSWVYSVTEFARAALPGATRIANPGCYPTATLLAVVPFARAGTIGGPVIVDGFSGVTGAGRKAEERLSAAVVEGNIAAYGTVPHRHVPEMERALGTWGGNEMTVSFIPHLVPMPRGLLVTARAALARELEDSEALEILHDLYDGERFVQVVDRWPSTKPVSGSNSAHVFACVDQRAGMLIMTAAIDNLGKGAAGQAVQNANVVFGLDEGDGLPAIGVWP